MTPLTLRADEAAALWRDGAVVVRRPIGDSVHAVLLEGAGFIAGPGWDGAGPAYRIVGAAECPLGSPGDRVWVREPFSEHEDGVIAYAADGHDPHDVPTDRWQAPVTMPRWASRGDAVIASVEVEADPWTWVVRVEVAP